MARNATKELKAHVTKRTPVVEQARSPYEAAEPTQELTPARSDPLAGLLAPPPSAATVAGHAVRLVRATGGSISRAVGTLRHLQRQYGNRYVGRVVAQARASAPARPALAVQPKLVLDPQESKAPGAGIGGPGVGQENKTGLPDNLKAGIEALSGLSMDDVRVHYNSSKPVQLGAVAYTQERDIHVAPGQERHLPHEAWHVVQQKQGRVKPTTQAQGVAINDDEYLESEANFQGDKAAREASVASVGRRSEGRKGSGAVNHKILGPDKANVVVGTSRPIQRTLTIEKPQLTVDKTSHHSKRREIWNELEKVIQGLGLAMTVPARIRVWEWIQSKEETKFSDPGAVVNELINKKLLYRKPLWARIGPIGLGRRPAFTGRAKEMVGAEGEQRRHIISSSTLGRAIEDSWGGDGRKEGKRDKVYEFLRRHGLDLMETEKIDVDLVWAMRKAWEITSSHVGNLWLGEGVPNMVRGFIRRSLRAVQELLPEMVSIIDGRWWASVDEIVNVVKVPRGPGMLKEEAENSWSAMVEQLKKVLQHEAKNGMVEKERAEDTLKLFEATADLDFPPWLQEPEQAGPGETWEKIIKIYGDLNKAGPEVDIFGKGGPLDQLMELGENWYVPSKKRKRKPEQEEPKRKKQRFV
jgi:hypothetical protein